MAITQLLDMSTTVNIMNVNIAIGSMKNTKYDNAQSMPLLVGKVSQV